MFRLSSLKVLLPNTYDASMACYGLQRGEGVEMRTVPPLLLKCHPHLLAVHPDPTDEALTTESQRYNSLIPYRGNAVPNACPEASR
jgi:hypothetical protein